MREAVIEQKAGVRAMQEALRDADATLAQERAQLETAERRRELAVGINDAETTQVAERFATKHRERVAVLERKVAAQREELALAERDLVEMTAQLQEAARKTPQAERSLGEAWASLGEAGAPRPGVDPADEVLKTQMDRAAREATADQKLEELKRKMGRS